MIPYGLTLAEYNRRWDLVITAFQLRIITAAQALDAIRDLVRWYRGGEEKS